MSDWAWHIEELAAATAALLVDGPTAPALLDATATLAARDAVLVELGALVAAVSDVPRLAPVRELTVFDLIHRPGQALSQALSELPRALPFGTPPSPDWPRLPGAHEQDWQRAAHASLALEGYVDALGRLPDEHAWNVLRDLADLAAALPYLDHDLAESLLLGPDSALTPDRHALLTHAGHDAVRLAAGELRARVPSVHAPADCPPARVARAQASGAGEPSHLGHVMNRLVHTVSLRGAHLSVPDLRAVSRLLETGSRDAAQILHRTSEQAPAVDRTVSRLQAVGGAARQLRNAPAKSMTAAHLDLMRASSDLRELLEIHAAQNRAGPSRAVGSEAGTPVRIALEFAGHLPDLAASLEASVRQALGHGVMLIPGVPQRPTVNAITWVTSSMVASQEETSAVLAGVKAVCDATRGLGPAVQQAIGILIQPSDRATARPAQQALDAARTQARATRAQLRQILAERNSLQASPLAAAIPGHPRQAPARQPASRRP